MSVIKASVTDQVLKITSAPPLASGGVNETTVEFTFCEKWEGFEKTALFYREEGQYYYAVLDENDICIVPWEVYATAGTFYFSVFGNKDGVRRTANTVKYKATKGLPEEGAIPSDPTPEVYEQLVTMVAKAVDIAEDMESKRDSGYFKGEKGDQGVRGYTGARGMDGVGISYISVYNNEMFVGQHRVHIVYTDGRTFNFNVNDGDPGEDGYTPKKGVDYWTEEDKAEIKAYVDEAILGGAW